MNGMHLRNDREHYGVVSVVQHWVMAVLIFGLFFLGDYMVDLDYYHPWYHKAPDLHRSLGILAAALLLLRWVWRLLNPLPVIEGRPWERQVALWVHRLFYLLIAGAVVSGYLISTADGQGIEVFDWFTVPAVFYGIENQADIAGEVHDLLTHALFFLALLHSLAALKHHFIDRDATLRRMLVPGGTRSTATATNPPKE